MRKIIISIVSSVALLGGGTAIGLLLVASRPSPPRVDPTPARLSAHAITLAPRAYVERVTGFGVVEARDRLSIASELNGRVVETLPDLRPGRAVEEGELLVRLDDAEWRAALARSEALAAATTEELRELEARRRGRERARPRLQERLAIAQRELDRLEGLAGPAAAAVSELDRQRAQVEQLAQALVELDGELAELAPRAARLEQRRRGELADVDRARVPLDRTRITAPFAGSLAEVDVTRGATVRVGETLAVLVSRELTEIALQIPASQAGALSPGTAGRVWVEASGGDGTPVRILRIAPEADREHRTVTLYLEASAAGSDDRTRRLRPGTFVRGEFPGRRHERCLAIPRSALIEGTVYTLEEGRAHAVRPTLGARLEELVVVTSGLSAGDRVLTSNVENLYPGLLVDATDDAVDEEPDVSRDGTPPATGEGG